MSEENKGQTPEQEEEPVQGEELVQEPEEPQQQEEPAKEKGEGLLMPFLYALLAGAGAFTLALILGIVLTYFHQPEEPPESPSEDSSSQVTLTPSPNGAETQEPQESDGPDADDETETQEPDGGDAGTGDEDTPG